MIRLLLVATLAIAGLGLTYLPWWGSLGPACIFILGGLFFLLSHRMKGRVLRGATAHVHAVAPTSPTRARLGQTVRREREAQPRFLYRLNVTIDPRLPSGKFTLWGPGALRLVLPETSPDSDDDACRIEELELEQDGGFQRDEGWEIPGARRLRMLLAVRPDVRKLRFRYHFEHFGEVMLPAVAMRQSSRFSGGGGTAARPIGTAEQRAARA